MMNNLVSITIEYETESVTIPIDLIDFFFRKSSNECLYKCMFAEAPFYKIIEERTCTGGSVLLKKTPESVEIWWPLVLQKLPVKRYILNYKEHKQLIFNLPVEQKTELREYKEDKGTTITVTIRHG